MFNESKEEENIKLALQGLNPSFSLSLSLVQLEYMSSSSGEEISVERSERIRSSRLSNQPSREVLVHHLRDRIIQLGKDLLSPCSECSLSLFLSLSSI